MRNFLQAGMQKTGVRPSAVSKKKKLAHGNLTGNLVVMQKFLI